MQTEKYLRLLFLALRRVLLYNAIIRPLGGTKLKEITSVHNSVVQLLRTLQKPKARKENGVFVAESAKMVREAVELGFAACWRLKAGAKKNMLR